MSAMRDNHTHGSLGEYLRDKIHGKLYLIETNGVNEAILGIQGPEETLTPGERTKLKSQSCSAETP